MVLTQQIPIVKLLKLFPEEKQEIKNFRINGERPYAVLIPAFYGIAKIRTFSALKATTKIFWMSIDENSLESKR